MPIKGGNDWRSARTVCPPFPVVRVLEGGLLKSKTKSASLGMSFMRSTALGARIRDWIRERLSVPPLTVVLAAEAGEVLYVGAAAVRIGRRVSRRAAFVVCISGGCESVLVEVGGNEDV